MPHTIQYFLCPEANSCGDACTFGVGWAEGRDGARTADCTLVVTTIRDFVNGILSETNTYDQRQRCVIVIVNKLSTR